MQLASSVRIPDGFMAAMRLGGEKPHQGLPGRNPALYQGPTVCNSTTALGLQAAAVLNRIGSCSTGKERDSESGNDYFGARYYSSSMGRFLSPDFNNAGDDPEPIPYADLEGPQSLNLYSYVGNNPLYRKDADGHSYVVYDGSANTLTLYS
jgi:RHS repeat-associated protein